MELFTEAQRKLFKQRAWILPRESAGTTVVETKKEETKKPEESKVPPKSKKSIFGKKKK